MVDSSPMLPEGAGLVHEFIERDGGAERVLDELAAMSPRAPIYSLWSDNHDRYPGHPLVESWLSRTALRRRKSLALPLMVPTWDRSFRKREHSVVVISSHAFAHRAQFAPGTPTLAYIHTPARYLWAPDVDSRGARIAASWMGKLLRSADSKGARRATHMLANSRYVAGRIKRAWDIDATVVYPPVRVNDVAKSLASEDSERDARTLRALPEEFLLGASRFVPYKRLELVIAAGAEVGLPVVIVGGGPDEVRLRNVAECSSSPVIFLGRVSDALLYRLYNRAQAYVFPAVEDFGIMPVEAMAAGARVIAMSRGGPAETVVDGRSGILCSFDGPGDFKRALARSKQLDLEEVRRRAGDFSEIRFQSQLSYHAFRVLDTV